MRRLILAVIMALALTLQPLHADDATNAASNRIFDMVMTYGLPFGTKEMGQKVSMMRFGNGSSVLTVAHPERDTQKKKLVFTFASFGEKPIMSHFEDVGPIGAATNVKIADQIKVEAAQVAARYGEILMCLEEVANHQRMCSQGALIFELLGMQPKKLD